jgi:hypothetical protein
MALMKNKSAQKLVQEIAIMMNGNAISFAYTKLSLVMASVNQVYFVCVTDFCCDEFVYDCGTTKPLSEQHVSMSAGKLKACLDFGLGNKF